MALTPDGSRFENCDVIPVLNQSVIFDSKLNRRAILFALSLAMSPFSFEYSAEMKEITEEIETVRRLVHPEDLELIRGRAAEIMQVVEG